MIKRIKQQSQEIQDVAFKNLKYNALLPENVLYSMMKSDDLEVREAALKKIISIRKIENVGLKMKCVELQGCTIELMWAIPSRATFG
ncbi:Hypothetical predicted protein [Octopus vulgaris]|uniref:Uncharacterized protein n=1 Tax=Octopus vulgaris TaxID=6645 RepID=A0AA36AFY0_OCTVU|nr:Hypothetical predicted protein [Octopus vulgaris]